MNSIKFHEANEFDWGQSGLLVTSEDMHVLSSNRIDFPLQNAYILALTDTEKAIILKMYLTLNKLFHCLIRATILSYSRH